MLISGESPMAHCRQTGKAIDKFYEPGTRRQATDVQEFAQEHAGIECFGVEADQPATSTSTRISSACNNSAMSATDAKAAKVPPRGIEPLLPD